LRAADVNFGLHRIPPRVILYPLWPKKPRSRAIFGAFIADLKLPMKKTWREKLADDKDLPKVGEVTGKLSKRWGAGRFVIPAPREVDALMKQVPKGRVVTINELRAALARKHKTDFTCPITTGIFAWIAAHAAVESEAEGAKRITPFWRTLKQGGEVNPKYPGGVEGGAKRLRAEGHQIIAKGKRMLVADFEKKLFAKLK
jgi:6-O-methylguanine DNA methyltransferase, DNA binding domain